MKTFNDVRQLLRRFGIVVYMGNRLYDIEMSQIELREVHENGLISTPEYLEAELILRQEHRREQDYLEKKRKRYE